MMISVSVAVLVLFISGAHQIQMFNPSAKLDTESSILTEIESLKREMLQIKKENLQIKQEYSEIKLGMESMKLEGSEMKIKTDPDFLKLRNDVNHLVDQCSRSQNESMISFTAYATESRGYMDQELVVFDGIARNYGNAYNPEVSIFQCPINGYYLFFMSFYAGSDNYMRAEIYMDGSAALVNAYADMGSVSSTLAVSYCASGELVWVKGVGDGLTMDVGSGGRYSSFTGTLLHSV